MTVPNQTLPQLLQTKRLILRRWKSSDLEPFARLNADPQVMEHFPSTLTRTETQAGIERIEAGFDTRGFGLWAVERKEDGAFIGFVGLSVPRFDAHFTPCVEVGWRLSRDFWGNGYAPEAARAALRDGFERVQLPEIVSMTTATNLKSMRVMEKIGMSRNAEDDFDHPLLAEGHHLRRHVLYRLTERNWRQQCAGSSPQGSI